MAIAVVVGAAWLVSAVEYQAGRRSAVEQCNQFVAEQGREQSDCASELYNVEDRLTRCLSGVRYAGLREDDDCCEDAVAHR